MLEQELIQTAIDKLKQQTGLGINLQLHKNDFTDGELTLPGVNKRLIIECKKWLNKANLQRYVADININNTLTNVLLVTDYINPNQAALLQKKGATYLDLAGNAYINLPPIYIDIQGKKPDKPHNEIALVKQLGKAFQPKGMKVVLMLLTQTNLVETPMRTIADTAEVALGTVKQVIDDLIYQGFIIQKGQQKKELVNKQELLKKWLDAYPANMKAKLNTELYTTNTPDLIKALDLAQQQALWGGEYAAQQYDNYLMAKDYLIYVRPEYKNDILKAARLRKPTINEQVEHKVLLVEPPVAIEKIQTKGNNLAHPLLVYANLMTSDDPRNADAARRLYENYLT